MTERIVVGSDGRKYITHEPAPQREWVGLTDEEVDGIGCDFSTLGGDIDAKDWLAFYLAIEAALKAKNA